MTPPLSGVVPEARTSAADPGRYRPELQGVRALACALVVGYHVWGDRVSGGVDVFFVITGFLLVTQLVRAAGRGPLRLFSIWGRTLRRLVPTTAVVLVGSVLGALLFLPESRWPQTAQEVAASALFVQNWQLIADATDYYADQAGASVVQHLWSLSIQGQFSILLPVAVALLAYGAVRTGYALRTVVLAALVVTTTASLAFSIWYTAVEQQVAYFHTLTRLWEFTVGGLLGLLIAHVRLPSTVRVVLGWIGFVALVLTGVLIDVEGGFPGYYALWPVLAAALMLISERTDGRAGVDHLLASGPMQYLGRISFPLFLWHWPVLVLWLVATRSNTAGLLGGLVVVGVSLALAVATDRFVDGPMLRAPSWRFAGYRSGAVATVTVLVLAFGWQAVAQARSATVGLVGDPNHPGAAALMPGFDGPADPDAPPIPSAVAAGDDWVLYQDACVRPDPEDRLERCSWVASPDPDAPTVVVVGDSHMQQLLPAIEPVARERGWRVDTLIRPGCPFSTTSESNVGEVDCIAWNQLAIPAIIAESPDLVVTLASVDARPGPTERTPPGVVEALTALSDAGIPVAALRDNPRFEHDPPSCLETYGSGAPECDVPRELIYSDTPPATLVDLPPTVTYVDLADAICESQVCRPEVGNVTVYLDDNHLTATFAASLAPVLGPRLDDLVDR